MRHLTMDKINNINNYKIKIIYKTISNKQELTKYQ
jgi:hypothetical protein